MRSAVTIKNTGKACQVAGVNAENFGLKYLWIRKTLTEKITSQKTKLKDKIKTEKKFVETVEAWDKEKNAAIKALESEAHKNNSSLDKKQITLLIQDAKSKIQSSYNDKLNLFKEELTEEYFNNKKTLLKDYPIFMAIAEDIGYDATGRQTNNNELIEIGNELAKFIKHIDKTEK